MSKLLEYFLNPLMIKVEPMFGLPSHFDDYFRMEFFIVITNRKNASARIKRLHQIRCDHAAPGKGLISTEMVVTK